VDRGPEGETVFGAGLHPRYKDGVEVEAWPLGFSWFRTIEERKDSSSTNVRAFFGLETA